MTQRQKDIKAAQITLLISLAIMAIMLAGCSGENLHQCPNNDSHYWAKYYGHTNWKRAF